MKINSSFLPLNQFFQSSTLSKWFFGFCQKSSICPDSFFPKGHTNCPNISTTTTQLTRKRASCFLASALSHFPFYPIGLPHSSQWLSLKIEIGSWCSLDKIPGSESVTLCPLPTSLRCCSIFSLAHTAPGHGLQSLACLFLSVRYASTGWLLLPIWIFPLRRMPSLRNLNCHLSTLTFIFSVNILYCLKHTWFCFLVVYIFLSLHILFLLWQETGSIRGVTFFILATDIPRA